jgi:SAM-dependent MidA family methyltransferase
VHRVVGRGGGVRELFVDVSDAGFAWVEAEPSTPALAARLAAEDVRLADGEVTEVCLALDAWLAEATASLERGVVVLVDYAAEPLDLHGAARPSGTLRAFARHAVGADPLRHVGRQDLTATVDLAAVRASAASAGLKLVGESTQAELLASVGTASLTARFLRDGDVQAAIELRSALARLMDPRFMGGYRVLVFGRGLPAGTELTALRRVTGWP